MTVAPTGPTPSHGYRTLTPTRAPRVGGVVVAAASDATSPEREQPAGPADQLADSA